MTPQKPHIIAIDDTPANLMTLGAALADEYQLQFATSGLEGLALAKRSPPDLILLDIMMPEMDGYEVSRRLMADPVLKNIPIIFVTALTESDAEIAGLALGAADYLTKPVNVDVARQRINNLLERERLRKEVESYRDHLEELVKSRTKALSIAKEAAEGANRLKLTILANISHEFRTPMNGILGMVGMVKRRTQDPKSLDYLGKAEDSANRLLGTLTGLLDLANAESARLTLDHAPFVPAEVIGKVGQEYKDSAESKGIVLDFCVDETEQVGRQQFMGDPLRIQQIVYELVGNALKFSDKGTVTVRSSIELEATGRPSLVCVVSDQGIGIAQENLRLIFEPFHQIDGSSTRQYGGNGIGLALCRQLARNMGGEISVSSTFGQGSTFTLRLPLEMVPEAEAQTAPAQDPMAQLQARHAGASILVAEDSLTIQSFLVTTFENAGLNTFVANDGEEAIEMASSAQFDLLLLDLKMPKVSGIQAAETIRHLPNYQKTPILAVTARAYEEDREECLRAGINAHVPKPVSPQLLLSIVLEWLDQAKAEKYR